MSSNTSRRLIPALWLCAIAMLFPSRGARAQTITEVGDTGALPVSAQVETATTISVISGEIDGSTDVDMYAITIDDPINFSATTDGGSGTLSDTRLYLFDGSGKAVYFNDDIVNESGPPNYLSALPSGHADGPTVPGDYYIAIASYPKYPGDGSTRLFLEPDFDPVNYEDVLGPNPGTTNAISQWNGAGNQVTGTYEITLTGVNGTLATELVAFNVQLDQRRAIVAWTTSSEDPGLSFDVQLRNTSRGTWVLASHQEGAGHPSAYRVATDQLPVGTHYFRLKMMAPDGSVSYSGTVEVDVDGMGGSLLASVYPNPFSGAATISIRPSRQRNVTVDVFNIVGQRVARLFEGYVQPDAPIDVTLAGENLAPGIYIIKAHGEGFVETRTATKLASNR